MANRKKTLDFIQIKSDFALTRENRKLFRNVEKRHPGFGASALFLIINIQGYCARTDNGYYVNYDDDLVFDLEEQTGCPDEYIRDILDIAAKCDVLDRDLYARGILSSSAMQTSYYSAMERLRRTVDWSCMSYWVAPHYWEENTDKPINLPKNEEKSSHSYTLCGDSSEECGDSSGKRSDSSTLCTCIVKNSIEEKRNVSICKEITLQDIERKFFLINDKNWYKDANEYWCSRERVGWTTQTGQQIVNRVSDASLWLSRSKGKHEQNFGPRELKAINIIAAILGEASYSILYTHLAKIEGGLLTIICKDKCLQHEIEHKNDEILEELKKIGIDKIDLKS